jgi:hypothetical protein
MKKFIIFAFAILVFSYAKAAAAATLNFNPTSGSFTAGQTFTVDVNLDTAGAAIDGVDLYKVHFSPSILQVKDMDTGTSGVQITEGTLFSQTLTNSADNSAGTITFSQLTTGGTTYTGSGKLATITFVATANGTSPVTFDFTLGSTSDTNVAGGKVDKLTSVNSASFTVTGGTYPTPYPTPLPNTDNLPNPGLPDSDSKHNSDPIPKGADFQICQRCDSLYFGSKPSRISDYRLDRLPQQRATHKKNFDHAFNDYLYPR